MRFKFFFLALLATLCFNFFSHPAFAAPQRAISLSPMNQTVELTPGEEYSGSFKINNPSGNSAFEYRLEATPFWVDASYEAVFESFGNYNLITNWISLPEATGTIPAGSSKEVPFLIKTPLTATSGGQYMVIKVSSRDGSTSETASGTRGAYSLAHVLYAEVAGEGINRSGAVENVKLPGFLLGRSKAFSTTATVKNTGNTLGVTTLTVEAYPLFSNELKYSNLDNPSTFKILPESSRTVTLTWDSAPSLGIFKLIHKVTYNNNVIATNDGFVFIVPIWLIVVLLLLIVGVIVLIITLKKRRNNVQTPPVQKSIVEE